MDESEERCTPKLSLLSTCSMWEWELPEAQGTKTPPIIAPLSIPFKWEEAPGKPKPKPRDLPSGLSASRSLHLPPRLLLHDHGSPSFGDAGTKLWTRSYSSRPDLLSHSQPRHKFDSPTSILNSPPSSASSRGSSTCSQDIGCVLTHGDEVARHKMRRLLDHWTPSLRWPKPKEDSSDDDQRMPPTHSCIAPPTKKWLLTKMKRSSRVFGTILKRMRSRISGEEGR